MFVGAVMLAAAATFAPALANVAAPASDSVDLSLSPPDAAPGNTAATAADASHAGGSAEQEHGAFSILFENDIFFDTDRDYTSGEELAYTTAPDETPEGLVDFAHDLPTFLMAPGEVRASYEIGQDIFTPTNTHLVVPLPTERPYAGFLYLGLGLLTATRTILTSWKCSSARRDRLASSGRAGPRAHHHRSGDSRRLALPAARRAHRAVHL